MGASKEQFMSLRDETPFPITGQYGLSEQELDMVIAQGRQTYINNANTLYCAEFMTEAEYNRITNRIDKTFDNNDQR